MKLRDALFLVHPKDKDAQRQAIFDKIVNRQLEVPYTWEVELSALGQQHFESDEDRKKAFALKWQELIESGKMGYMALMRNLSNILFFLGGVWSVRQRGAASHRPPERCPSGRPFQAVALRLPAGLS